MTLLPFNVAKSHMGPLKHQSPDVTATSTLIEGRGAFKISKL